MKMTSLRYLFDLGSDIQTILRSLVSINSEQVLLIYC